jgi:geranylgeranyl reductase family protein
MKSPKERFYDVIIAGAGPAGATLGYELARRGAGVLLMEKERLPRYKPCAGGITVKAADGLGLDIAPVTRSVVRGVTVTYKGHRSFTKWYDKPLILMVMRDEFDHLLVRRAQEAGVTLLDNEAVCRIEISSRSVKATTAGKTLESRIIVGADGARSTVARDAGLMRGVSLGMGMEAETSVAGEKLVQWDSLMGLDLGHIRGGYGWVFPKKDHLSIGVGGPLRQARRLRSGYRAVLKSYNLETGSVSSLRSHYLPVRRKGMAIQSMRCLLLGDAAGLVDPLTGEGIHHAVRSAQMAASVIQRCLQADSPDLREYQDDVDREIMPELTAARGLARLFTWFPGLCFGLVEGHDRLWRACCRLLRGEETYVSIKQRLHPFEGLFDLLTI